MLRIEQAGCCLYCDLASFIGSRLEDLRFVFIIFRHSRIGFVNARANPDAGPTSEHPAKGNKMKKYVAIGILSTLSAAPGQAVSGWKEMHTRAAINNYHKVVIPPECKLKAEAISGSASLSRSQRTASEALVSVLNTAASSLQVSYILQPELIRRTWGTLSTEIKLAGKFTNVSITLLDATGATIASTQGFGSLGEAHSSSAAAYAAENLVQTNTNQMTMQLDVVATRIARFNAHFTIHSDYRSQAAMELIVASGGNTAAADANTLVTGRAMTLADLVTKINVDATVSFDGRRMLVTDVKTDIGC